MEPLSRNRGLMTWTCSHQMIIDMYTATIMYQMYIYTYNGIYTYDHGPSGKR